jgi:serine/threonine protein kinase
MLAVMVQVIDFGLSHHMNSARTIGVGTPDYMAPEMILGARVHGEDSGSYDAAAVDVWGLGIILYLMLLGRFPFQVDSLADH